MENYNEIDKKKILFLEKQIITMESQNLKTKLKQDAQIVNDIKKLIEEYVNAN